MSRIAGLIPRNNKGTPRLDAVMITRLLGTKQIVRDGFFFTENQQASAKFGSIQIVIDCSIFNADDFSTPQKKLPDAQRVLLSISKIGIVRTLKKINGRFCLSVFDNCCYRLTCNASMDLSLASFCSWLIFFALATNSAIMLSGWLLLYGYGRVGWVGRYWFTK